MTTPSTEVTSTSQVPTVLNDPVAVVMGFLFKKVLTTHRLVVAISILTSLSAFILGIVGIFPSAWQNYALVAVAVTAKALVAIKYVEGAQKTEIAKVAGPTAGVVVNNHGVAPH